MRSLLHDPPVVDNEDRIRVDDGREPVRDDKACPRAHELVHGLLNENLRAGVHIAGRFVENEDVPVG